MFESSTDMVALVQETSARMKKVIPDYMRIVGDQLPQAVQAREWTKTFIAVNERFLAGDYRHTSKEFGQIAELAQWLVNLHCEAHKHPPKQLTLHESLMVVERKSHG